MDLSLWSSARDAALRAERAPGGCTDQSARARASDLVRAVQRQAEAAEADHALLGQLDSIRSGKPDSGEPPDPETEYPRAFQKVGLELGKTPPEEVGAKIRSRPISAVVAIATAIDHWASTRRDRTPERQDLLGAAKTNRNRQDR